MKTPDTILIDGVVHHKGRPVRRAFESEERARRREAAKMSLLMMGMSPNLVGYYYLAEAISMAAEKYAAGDWQIWVSKLYEQIAIERKTSPASIEKAVRYAIEKSYASPEITAARVINTIADMIA